MFSIQSPGAGFGVYVHVPFCTRKCPYCDFYVRTDIHRQLTSYEELLPQEWELQRVQWGFSGIPLTLYFGGGTPSLLSPATIRRWVDYWKRLGLPDEAEITLEANPDDADRFADFASAGINRISIGCQSFVDTDLVQLGRTHRAIDNKKAVEAARGAGFQSVSIDLIFALPFSSLPNWHHTLADAIALAPDHISAYSLIVDPGSAFWSRKQRGQFSEADEYRVDREMNMTFELLDTAGYDRYEVSNFAKPGHESRHNRSYWTGVPYLGSGPAAHGYTGNVRYANPSDLFQWKSMLEQGVLPHSFQETVSSEQHRTETITLGLRLKRGLFLSDPMVPVSPNLVKQVVDAGWGVVEGERLVLTTEGLIREQAISRLLI